MAEAFPVAFLFFAGAALLLVLPRGPARAGLLLAVPLVAFAMVWALPEGNLWTATLIGVELEFTRVDKLSRVFALIFCFAAFLGNLYAWHVRDLLQQVAALLYAGSAIGATFAGDMITLFLFWEGTAITSVFLIWARRTQGAYHTGLRYLVIQIGSGVLLLAGAGLYWRDTGSLAFEAMTLGSPATWAIFLAFGIKAAFPLLHNWLQDAYPAATITGTVILSAFTTKLAIYALARGFAGTETLIWLGAIMAVVPVFYAIIENDMRRVLAYSLNNQLGFMVVGVGVGTELALNGVAAHAVAHILYKSLLFMTVGAVMFRTGTARGSDLGGLYRTMPLTAIFCVIGAMAISAFPLFSGFVSKSLILSAAAHEHYTLAWAALLFASAGVLHKTGIRVPYFIFFARDSGLRPKEAPPHMLLAMGIPAALCVLIGIFPGPLYALLPYPVDYEAYTVTHLITQMQYLMAAALAFVVLVHLGVYPREMRAINLDFDWTYRRLLPAILRALSGWLAAFWALWARSIEAGLSGVMRGLYRSHGPEGRMAAIWPTGSMVLAIAIVLGVTLIVNFAS